MLVHSRRALFGVCSSTLATKSRLCCSLEYNISCYLNYISLSFRRASGALTTPMGSGGYTGGVSLRFSYNCRGCSDVLFAPFDKLGKRPTSERNNFRFGSLLVLPFLLCFLTLPSMMVIFWSSNDELTSFLLLTTNKFSSRPL